MDSEMHQPAAVIKPVQAREPFPETALKALHGYEIIAKLGQGGMGAVYKARQRSLDRIVALKLLPPQIARDGVFIERFQREARTSARLCHPNVVQGFDVGQDPATGLWYFAMEFVDGPSLKKLIKETRRIPERKALEIVREVARGLDAIAALGMVHRDIKPDNILLSRRGEVKIADLGLTRAVDDDSEMTQSGQAVGTPHYMAPEQVRGLSDLDIRMDLYALGATLFHAVTGTTPFKGNSMAEIMSHQLTETPPLAHTLNGEVSEATSRLILKLMEKVRSNRIQTPQDLIARIDGILEGCAKRAIGTRVGPKPSPLTHPPARQTTAPRLNAKHTARPDGMNSSTRNALRSGTAPMVWAMLAGGVLAVGGICAALTSGSTPAANPVAQNTNAAQTAVDAVRPVEHLKPALPPESTRMDKTRAVLNSIPAGKPAPAELPHSDEPSQQAGDLNKATPPNDPARKLDAPAADIQTVVPENRKGNEPADAAPIVSKPETVNPEPEAQDLAAFEVFRQELAPLLKQAHFSVALERLGRKLDDPASAKYRPALQREKSDLEAVIALRQQAIEALHSSAKPVTLRRGKTVLTGKVTSDSKGLTLKLADGPEMTIAPDQLEASDIDAYAPKPNGTARAEELRRRALLFLYVEDFGKARELFTAAQDAGLGETVAPYLERLSAREHNELEVRAQKDWLAADKLFAAKRWDEARAAYSSFAIAYKSSDTFARYSTELEERQLAIELQLHPLKEGLIGSYYRGADFNTADRILTRVDATVDFDWTKTPPAPEVPHDNYCVRWEGMLKIAKAGRYTIAVSADDGARLWVDGKQLVNEWSAHPLTRFPADVELTAGMHEIKVEYLQQYVDAICKLTWSVKGSFAETVIPASALWHDAKIKVPETKP